MNVPSGLMATVPFDGWVLLMTDKGSFSGSLSLASTLISMALSNAVVTASLRASGAKFASGGGDPTETVTVAVSSPP